VFLYTEQLQGEPVFLCLLYSSAVDRQPNEITQSHLINKVDFFAKRKLLIYSYGSFVVRVD